MRTQYEERDPIMHLGQGSSIATRCRILRELDHDGMGTVLLARDERFSQLERLCAIKVMRASGDPTVCGLQQTPFERKAALGATLRHSAIPQVGDFLVEQPVCCLVLEFVPREDLEHYLARTGQPVIE